MVINSPRIGGGIRQSFSGQPLLEGRSPENGQSSALQNHPGWTAFRRGEPSPGQ
jgi:hypothetical protein